MEKKYEKYYEKIRNKIKIWIEQRPNVNKKWSSYILAAPDLFYLLIKLMLDDRVDGKKKLKLAAVVAYFMSPIDLLPEAIVGPIGLLDDIALAAMVLNDLLNEIDPIVVREHWKGDWELLNLIRSVLHNANNMLGGGIWNKLMNKFKSFQR